MSEEETLFTGRGMAAAFHERVMKLLLDQVAPRIGAASPHGRLAADPPKFRRSRMPRSSMPGKASAGKDGLVAALRSRGGAPAYAEQTETIGALAEPLNAKQSEQEQLRLSRRSAPAVPFLPLGGMMQEISPTKARKASRLSDMQGSPSMTENSQALVDQFNEYLCKGTPRGTPCSTAVSGKHVEHQVGAWAAARGLSEDEVWFAKLRPKPQTSPPFVQEAVILVGGVEVVADISVAVSFAGPGQYRANLVTGARTLCPWPGAQHAVERAAQVAEARPVEVPDFMDVLWGALATEARAGSVQSMTAHSYPGLDDSAKRRPHDDPSGLDAASHGPLSPEASPCGTQEDDEVLVKSSKTNSFVDWLQQRPPLWRCDNGFDGKAWDFPPSKAEKREMLLQHLFAAEEEQYMENVAAVTSRQSGQSSMPSASASAFAFPQEGTVLLHEGQPPGDCSSARSS